MREAIQLYLEPAEDELGRAGTQQLAEIPV